MKNITLIQPIKSINKIRLFNNKELFNNKFLYVDFSKIEFLEIRKKIVMFIPDNLCVFKTDYTDRGKLIADLSISVNEDSFIRSMAYIGLMPLVGCNNIKISTITHNQKKGINIIVTTKCNLNCEYCIYKMNDKYQMYSECTNGAIFEKLSEFILYHKTQEKIVFIFTGGEPLLAFEKITQIVAFIEKICFKFSVKPVFGITTNGTILNKKIINYLNQKNFIVSVSLDGNEEFYKKRNQLKQFKIVEKNIKSLQEKNIKVNIKATILNTTSKEELYTIIEYLIHLKPNEITITPDVSSSVPIYFNDIFNEFYSNRFTKYSSISQIISSQILNFSYKDRACSAGKDFITINENGELIPCLFFNGTNKYSFHKYDELLNNCEFFDNELKNNINNNYECSKCMIRKICGGHCSYISLQLLENKLHSDIVKSFCDYKRQAFLYSLNSIIDIT